MAKKRHWAEPYWRPKEICANCHHTRSSHLDNPFTKGGTPQNDRGWCTRPEGSCIFDPCKCLHFVEPNFFMVLLRNVKYFTLLWIEDLSQ